MLVNWHDLCNFSLKSTLLLWDTTLKAGNLFICERTAIAATHNCRLFHTIKMTFCAIHKSLRMSHLLYWKSHFKCSVVWSFNDRVILFFSLTREVLLFTKKLLKITIPCQHFIHNSYIIIVWFFLLQQSTKSQQQYK